MKLISFVTAALVSVGSLAVAMADAPAKQPGKLNPKQLVPAGEMQKLDLVESIKDLRDVPEKLDAKPAPAVTVDADIQQLVQVFSHARTATADLVSTAQISEAIVHSTEPAH